MEVTHIMDDKDYDLKVDYTQLLGKSWVSPLRHFLTTSYQTKMMFDIHEFYSPLNVNHKFVAKKDLFKPFQLAKYNDIKVVILNAAPDFDERCNGLAFGNKVTYADAKEDYDEELVNLFNIIEDEEYDGFKVDKDYSLESWAKQGVLLLNYSLHTDNALLRISSFKFIKEILNTLSLNKTGIIFCLLNDKHQSFNSCILHPNNHHILTTTSSLRYPLLKSINDIIEKANGKSCRIRW